MRRLTRAILLLAVVATACDTGTTTTPEPLPAVTTTVTEYVTETPTPVPAAGDPCDVLVGGETLAFLFVTTPAPGTMVSSGFTFSGCSNVFEAAHSWALRDNNGAIIANGFGTASCGTGCVGTFQQTVNYSVSQTQVGSLEVFTQSAQDGSPQDVNTIPLVLQP